MSDEQRHMRACLAALRQIRAHIEANEEQELFDSALFDVWMSKLEDGTGQDFSQFQIDNFQVPAADYLVTVSTVIAYLESMLGLDQPAESHAEPAKAPDRPIDADFTDIEDATAEPGSAEVAGEASPHEPSPKSRTGFFHRLVR